MIVPLDNYGKLPDAIVFFISNPTMSVQDDYDTSDMNKKGDEIITKFEDALGRKTGETWDINYTSSSTAQVDQLANAKAVNLKVQEYLKGKKGHLGLILMNFPGATVGPLHYRQQLSWNDGETQRRSARAMIYALVAPILLAVSGCTSMTNHSQSKLSTKPTVWEKHDGPVLGGSLGTCFE